MKKLILLTLTIFFIGLTAEGQTDSTKIEKINQEKLQKLSNEIITEQARLKEQLRRLEDDIQSSDKFNEILAQANRYKYNSHISTLSKRYDAGEEILYHIIKETNSFNLSFSQLVLQDQFNRLIDPLTYSEFNNAMNSTLELLGKRKPFPTVDDFNNLKQEIPALDNPFITTGLSIATFFLAKYHRRRALESKNLKSLTCVLSFSNTTKKDYDILIGHLYSLSKRLDNYNVASKDFFSSYLREINYEQGYTTDYPDEIDVVKLKKEEFFDNLRMEMEDIGVLSYESSNDDRITYQIEQVKFWMNEYELLLLEIKGFISNYRDFIEDTKTRGQSICSNFNNETSEIFTQISDQLRIVESNFNTVYVENRIPTPTKRYLFGFN